MEVTDIQSIMKRKNLTSMHCPTARALGTVGEWWSLLILRDVIQGINRFGELRSSLDISTNSLSRRLKEMTESGLLKREAYQHQPTRYEYHPTDKGRDLYPVIVMLFEWGKQHMFEKGSAPEIKLVNSELEDLTPVIVDAKSGNTIDSLNSTIEANVDATTATLRRIKLVRERTGKKISRGDELWKE